MSPGNESPGQRARRMLGGATPWPVDAVSSALIIRDITAAEEAHEATRADLYETKIRLGAERYEVERLGSVVEHRARQTDEARAEVADLQRNLLAAEEGRGHERKRRESLRVGACDDCGGMGHGPSYCAGPEIVETACPVCGGDGRSAIARERDEARERVAALASAYEAVARDLTAAEARVAVLGAVVERVRPVVEALAAACDREGYDEDGKPIDVHDLLLDFGRIGTPFDADAAWLRSLLSTGPDPAHRPGHTDLRANPRPWPSGVFHGR